MSLYEFSDEEKAVLSHLCSTEHNYEWADYFSAYVITSSEPINNLMERDIIHPLAENYLELTECGKKLCKDI